ncbi:MAG TPA: efflux RND transporter periplasmic adaptor subunit [Vicinamibacterales bacterium]|nr:efflux RND transporter periplasmic adaptor subunit [Vicinamibacterales bacterium]
MSTESLRPPQVAGRMRLRRAAAIAAAALGCAALWRLVPGSAGRQPDPPESGACAGAVVTRGPFVRTLRLAGITEAARGTSIAAPQLAATQTPLVITRLVPGGSRVRAGDILVVFDPQQQLQTAFERRAEHLDLEEQIRKKLAEQSAARARDDAELAQAENQVARARLEVTKNPLLPPIEAEKNTLALEQAEARLEQLRDTYSARRRAAAADVRILEIRRDRALAAMRHAEGNVQRMTIRAPFDGLVVLRTTWRGAQMQEIQEGDEVRPGTLILDVVDPSAMQVRTRINQVDVGAVRPGIRGRVRLDAYPDLEFAGRVELVSPLGVPGGSNPQLRTFVAIVAIDGADARLLPDLSASVDLEVDRLADALQAPRACVAVAPDGAWVSVLQGGRAERRRVTLGPVGADRVVIAAGVEPGWRLTRPEAID